MNILPKKRWHVRTKANIARVRKDEAEARETEEKEKRRSQISEREAKINFLRKKNKSSKGDSPEASFESSLSAHLLGNIDNARTGRNKEHDDEEKKIKEDYERKIGLLSYLSKKDEETKPWYIELRDKKTIKDHSKYHAALDPLNGMKKYLSLKEKSTSKKKKVKVQTKKCDKLTKQKKTIEELRALRLQREQKEREKEKQILLKHHPT